MFKTLIASGCALALVASGCGSDSSAKHKTACANAVKAMNAYHVAGEKVGTDFLNRTKDEPVIAAAAAFRAQLARLEPLTSSSERGQLQGLSGALEQHEKLLHALAFRNLPEAHKYATTAFEEALDTGQRNFRTICKVPQPK
jgi:hypothetical protein